jgi:glycosyltransferase involved in cell wall biosynthesis
MSMDFTVAIPTFNGAERLPKLLARLCEQINTEHFSWEIIIIDNNSQDKTAQLIQEYQANWKQPFSLKYYLETEQGAAFARLKAVKEAKGQLIGFLDDDNLPDQNWVSSAYLFGKDRPKAGAYGGQIHGEYETIPPENFNRIQSFLAIRERGNKPHLYNPIYLDLPPAASLVVRKQAWCEAVPNRPVLVGKINGSMVQGDDYEPLLYLHKCGWEIWYCPTMITYHQIPSWRLEKDYLISLVRGGGLCVCPLRLINAQTWQKPFIMAKIFLGSLIRAIKHLIKYKTKVKTELIPACEMQFYLSSLASPFYFLNNFLWPFLNG